MRTLRTLYHLARADFLERTRRYSFLLMLLVVIWLGYAAVDGQMIMRIYPDYTGEVSSAWVGTLMTLTITFFLDWFGFYLIKGSVARDYQTGVGQIMAATPISRPVYLLGKWLSNFAVLGVMVLILMASGILMILFLGSPQDLWALFAPLLIIALSCLAFTAAIAVLFESIEWLRGGFGNVVYFIAFLLLIIPAIETSSYIPVLDVLGFRLIGDNVALAAQMVYPESTGAFTFTITNLDNPKLFPFAGIQWAASLVAWRIVIFVTGMVTAMLSSIFFDRFNPSKPLPLKTKKVKLDSAVIAEPFTHPDIHLTSLPAARSRLRFTAFYFAELKMLLKGQRWWWYTVAAGLVIAQLSNPPRVTHILQAIAWLWIVLILNKLGNREIRQNTSQMVYSAPYPVLTQLPAMWLAACTLVALTGFGAFVKFISVSATHSLISWLAGVAFIPSLALACGVLTGSSKLFEVLYVLWIYLVLQGIPALDFVGFSAKSPWQLFLVSALLLLIISALVRNWQLKRQ